MDEQPIRTRPENRPARGARRVDAHGAQRPGHRPARASAMEDRSSADRASDAITRVAGSAGFVAAHAVGFALWIAHQRRPGARRLAASIRIPFSFLTLVVSLEAIFLAIFVLMSQNRAARLADRRAHLDLQVDLLAERELTVDAAHAAGACAPSTTSRSTTSAPTSTTCSKRPTSRSSPRTSTRSCPPDVVAGAMSRRSPAARSIRRERASAHDRAGAATRKERRHASTAAASRGSAGAAGAGWVGRAAVAGAAPIDDPPAADRPRRDRSCHVPRAPVGRAIFRFDTFGDEQLWTGVLRMHEPIATLSPQQALAVGLKVDLDALPAATVAALKSGQVDLTDPAVTLTLLQRQRRRRREGPRQTRPAR